MPAQYLRDLHAHPDCARLPELPKAGIVRMLAEFRTGFSDLLCFGGPIAPPSVRVARGAAILHGSSSASSPHFAILHARQESCWEATTLAPALNGWTEVMNRMTFEIKPICHSLLPRIPTK